jgi:putative phage-type endonuclease
MTPYDSPMWLPARCGKFTASAAPKAFARTKTGWAASRQDVAWDIVSERMTGLKREVFVTEAMAHGTAMEDPACELYEAQTGILLRRSGLYDHPTIEFLAASPDREIGAEGLLECKCPTTKTHLQWIYKGVLPDDYKYQMLIQMVCTGRKWCEFISYDPRVAQKQQLFVRRFEPTDAQLKETEEMAAEFLSEVEAIFTKVTEA